MSCHLKLLCILSLFFVLPYFNVICVNVTYKISNKHWPFISGKWRWCCSELFLVKDGVQRMFWCFNKSNDGNVITENCNLSVHVSLTKCLQEMSYGWHLVKCTWLPVITHTHTHYLTMTNELSLWTNIAFFLSSWYLCFSMWSVLMLHTKWDTSIGHLSMVNSDVLFWTVSDERS